MAGERLGDCGKGRLLAHLQVSPMIPPLESPPRSSLPRGVRAGLGYSRLRACLKDTGASGPPSLRPPSGEAREGLRVPPTVMGGSAILEMVHIFTATSKKTVSQNHPADLLPNC